MVLVKKLSKAISSVPRSRFQKPRPNLPGSKRTDSSAPSAVRKTSETTQNSDTAKVENSSVNESSQKEDTLEKTLVLSIDDTSTNSETVKNSEDLIADGASQSNDTKTISEKLTTVEISQNNDLVKLSDDVTTKEKFENHSFKSSALKTPEKLQNVEKHEESTNTDEITQPNAAEESLNSNVLTDETSGSDETVNSTSANNESVPHLPGEKTLLSEVSDGTDIPQNTSANSTDKSSKYPHLTSILSKKRAEPKKEVQHKKRKKFRKGDAAPERSKMTMADLIYWNPTNTDPLSKSSVATEYETPNTSNIDDPEECPDADTPVEESNICDSVPKLVIAEDGSINIDQSSLVVSRNIAEPTVTEVIRKDDTTYSSFRKRPMTKHWTAKDTTIFYKALSLVGTDFGLMETIFPHRTRRELKLKFKREEKFNIDLINRAMYESHLTFDANTLSDLIKNLNDLTGDFSSENGQEDTQPSCKEKKKPTTRKRKAAKADKSVDIDISDSVAESVSNDVTSTSSDQEKTKRRRRAKKLPEDFVDTDEIDDIVLLEDEVSEETNSNDASCEVYSPENSSKRNLSNEKGNKSQSNISIPSSDGMCETRNIEILCIKNVSDAEFSSNQEESEAIFVPDNTSGLSEVITIQDNNNANEAQTISLATDNEQEQCITLEYVDVNEGDLTLLNNVMAFEVVASNAPIPKRRRKVNFTPKIPQKDTLNKPCQPLKLSSTNYTPV